MAVARQRDVIIDDGDPIASTSLLLNDTKNNNANSALRGKNHNETSRPSVSDVGGGDAQKVHFDGDDRVDDYNVTFVRETPKRLKDQLQTPQRNAAFSSRLSMAIRRSLRLGSKQRSTATRQASSTAALNDVRGFDRAVS